MSALQFVAPPVWNVGVNSKKAPTAEANAGIMQPTSLMPCPTSPAPLNHQAVASDSLHALLPAVGFVTDLFRPCVHKVEVLKL